MLWCKQAKSQGESSVTSYPEAGRGNPAYMRQRDTQAWRLDCVNRCNSCWLQKCLFSAAYRLRDTRQRMIQTCMRLSTMRTMSRSLNRGRKYPPHDSGTGKPSPYMQRAGARAWTLIQILFSLFFLQKASIIPASRNIQAYAMRGIFLLGAPA